MDAEVREIVNQFGSAIAAFEFVQSKSHHPTYRESGESKDLMEALERAVQIERTLAGWEEFSRAEAAALLTGSEMPRLPRSWGEI